MTDVIFHRGPDDEGFFFADGVGLGMRRLSIIDLAGGKQPISNEDGSATVVFNGEIYNYRELRRQLQRDGHFFKTESDTEVIVHLYEELGAECVSKLRGMFGFALWDARNNSLLLARDRLGIKPLYYTQVGDSLIFASEIKAILQHPDVDARLNLEALGNFLTLKYVPAPQTIFDDIWALPPGYLLNYTDGQIRVHQYWDLCFGPARSQRHHENVYAEQLQELLHEAIQLHLISDVPFGAFLSGGIDSSMIVALMSHYLNEPVKTFSVGFTGDGVEFSELPYARIIAERYQTDHYEVLMSAQDFMEVAEKVVWHLDQPIADQAALANYMVADMASRHVKMVLTGEGGDELFAGYARYAGERFSFLGHFVPKGMKPLIRHVIERHLPIPQRPKLALHAITQHGEVARFVHWFPLFNHHHKAELLSSKLKQIIDIAAPEQVFEEHLQRTDADDSLSRMLYLDTKLWLPDDLLARGDKTSMAASIEARVPFLDHMVVEFAAALPPHLKLKRLMRKYLLKKVGVSLLPPEIIRRKKEGFPMPVSIWFRHEARSFVRDLLSPSVINRRGLFDPGYVERLLDRHESGVADYGTHIWALLNVELWHRQFVDK